MNLWNRWVRKTALLEDDQTEESLEGCRSTILPPAPSGAVGCDSPATLRVPPVPEPANDLMAWADDTHVRDLPIDEDICWTEEDAQRETVERHDAVRPISTTWKCRVA